jgi:hypothetical protein
VSVYDNAGILNNWSLTDANGLSSRLTLREYMQNATSSYFDTNYNFTGTKTSYDLNYSSINLTTNYITDGGSKIVLTLTASGGGADLSPVVTLNSPANGYSTNLTSITFNCSATDDKRILNLSLYTNASGTFSKNYTNTSCSSTTCYLSYTLTLQTNKTYLWNCLAYDNASQSSWAQQNWTLNIVQQDIISNCSDGTLYGECSSTKPLYCSNGNLVNNCSYCNCSSGTCQSDGSCKISDNGGGGGGGGAPENQTNATNDATNTTINGSDTSKDVCGDGVCSVTEKAGECCQDCGCQTGYECKENSCEVINPPDNTNHIKTWIWIGMIIVAILLLIYIIFAIAREKRGD